MTGSVWMPELDALIAKSGFLGKTVAARLGLSGPSMVSLWRNGKQPVPSKYLDDLARILNVRFVVAEGKRGVGTASVVGEHIELPLHDVTWQDQPREPECVVCDPVPSTAPPRVRTQPRKGVLIGFDGMPMVPSTIRTYCTCGELVR